MNLLSEPFVWPKLPPLDECPEPSTAALILMSARGIILCRGGLVRTAIAQAAKDLRASEIGDILNGAIECTLFKEINTNHFDIDPAEVFYIMNVQNFRASDWSSVTVMLVRAHYLEAVESLVRQAAGNTPAASAQSLTSTNIPQR